MAMTAAHGKLLDLIQSHRVTAIIYVAAKLGLAEFLRDGPRTAGELAERTGANKDALSRLLTALTTIGICAACGEGRYALTELGALLDGTAEPSLKGWTIFEGHLLAQVWTGLLQTIMTGRTSAQLLGVENSFDLMARDPKKVQMFNTAMVDITRIVTPAIIQAYDFGKIAHLMDIGGGTGELLGAVAIQHPHICGTIFDLPRCAEPAANHLKGLAVGDRVKFLAGDFFNAIPPIGDAIIMKSIIHDWNDELSVTILGNCRKALPIAGSLLLVERLMPEIPSVDGGHKMCALSDLNMLRGPGGRERTEKQYIQLLYQSGFVHKATYPAGHFNVIEAEVALDDRLR
ncbi:methyltransferase [Bradyrhizobium sp. USDA 4454]